jgi:pullulanase
MKEKLMKKNFYAFLDDYNTISVIVPQRYRQDRVKKFLLRSSYMEQELEITSVIRLDTDMKYCCKFSGNIDLRKDYYVIDDHGYQNHIHVGRITKTTEFDDEYFYDGPLGVTYTLNHSIFRIWTPVAKEVILEIIDHTNQKRFVDLSYIDKGLWEACVTGDLEKSRYRYLVRINYDFKISTDPYGISSTANGKYNYIINPDKLYPMKHAIPKFSGLMKDAIIYEAHIRDMTIHQTSGVYLKGKYLGLVEQSFSPNGNTTGVTYLKELGITHLQLLPLFDFDAVDEANPDLFYNWGYNPHQYFVPEGWYSTKPDDPYARINELRLMIDSIHEKGILVNMDVVFNHVYDPNTFPFEKLVPNYYYRLDKNGNLSNASGCGNDLATEMKMVRRFIKDAVVFWQDMYQISGFRFDLMGLIDVETMNEVVTVAKSKNPDTIIYGEGWSIPTVYPTNLLSHMFNHTKLPQISFFNDRYRDTIKGSTFGNQAGYSLGNSVEDHDLRQLLTGSCNEKFLFEDPNQTLNYVECHDNHTFYDKMSLILAQATEAEKKQYQKLGLSLVLISQGGAFIHAGQEFLRSKSNVENSYRSSDDINHLNWLYRDINTDLVQTTKDLIHIRKSYPHFRLANAEAIRNAVTFHHHQDPSIFSFSITVEGKEILVVIKNRFSDSNVHTIVHSMKCFFNGNHLLKTPTYLNHLHIPGVYLYE